MDNDKNREQLQQAQKRIKLVDRFRMIFLFVALMLVLFMFYCNKFAEDAAWYVRCRGLLYDILFFCVLFMLACSMIKIAFTASYNKILKKQKEQG